MKIDTIRKTDFDCRLLTFKTVSENIFFEKVADFFKMCRNCDKFSKIVFDCRQYQIVYFL